MPVRIVLAAVLCTFLAASLAAQRPRTAADALARFAKVQDAAEAERRRAVADLGDFADDEVTTVLLGQLQGAVDPAYRQAVVRALGERPRAAAVVPALQAVLREATNNRLMDSAAEGLARQGEAGVQALGEVLAEERSGGPRRTSVCHGLGRAEGEPARDLLVREVQRAAGRDRLPALRALARRQGEAVVDELRLQLAGDKDPLLAATAVRQLADHAHPESTRLAVLLLHRLGTAGTAEAYAAVLRGLLVSPQGGDHESLVVAAALADDPFGADLAAAWNARLSDPAFVRWLVEQGPSRKSLPERTAVARLLGLVPEALRGAAAPALVKLLGHKEADVVRTAALSLAGFGSELGQAPLAKLLATGTEAMQPIAAMALHELRAADPRWTDELVSLASGRNAALRAAALQLLARVPDAAPDRVLAAAAENLAHKAWQVRAAAIDLIVALRAPAGVALLVERVGREEARLAQDLAEALFLLTRLRLADAAAWRAWWQKEGPTFVVPPADEARPTPPRGDRRAATAATYWDIPVRSDRVVFVVDVSGSMNQPFGTGGGTRLDEARRQLVRVFGQLPAKARANVVVFGNGADTFTDALQPVDERRRRALEQFAQDLEARGATNVHAALQRAFADPEVDTIFLLTDGQPSTGAIVEPGPLAEAVARWNVGRGIRIHTVAIGGRSEFLERLARDSGGEHAVAR